MVIGSLSSIAKWAVLIATLYILYKRGVLSLNSIFSIINYAKNKLRKIITKPGYATVEINLGNDYLADILPFDIHQYPEYKPTEKPKVIVPRWGVWLIAHGSILVKKAMPMLISTISGKNETENRDPSHPLENPYNDTKLIRAILDEIDKL